ncbi:MAG: alpha/beta hydrolase [Bacillota bacterium]
MKSKILIVLALVILVFFIIRMKYGPVYYAGAYNLLPLPNIKVEKNIKFGDEDRLKLDIYYSEEKIEEKKKVIFFVHGGSWKSNNKDQFQFIGKNLARRGYIAVLPNYRLVPENRYPTQIKDIAKALKWTEDNINKYGGDNKNIILSGHSAGGHLAALIGYSDKWQNEYNINKENISSLVLLAGVYKFSEKYENGAEAVKDFVPKKHWEDAQPVEHLDPSDPPTFVLQGLKDETVSPLQAEYLTKKLKENKIKYKSILKEKLNHLSLLFVFADNGHKLWDEIEFKE